MDGASLRALGSVPLNEAEIRALFAAPSSEVVRSRAGLESANCHLGVIRLWRQGSGEIDEETLARVREELPAPYEIVLNVRKLQDVRSQYFLRRLRGQKAAPQDSLSETQLDAAQQALEATTLSGQSLVCIEWLLILSRRSEAELKEDIELSARALTV